jgi:hypothetical protein
MGERVVEEAVGAGRLASSAGGDPVRYRSRHGGND